MQKKKEHLPMYGVGPIYVCVIAALTLASFLLRNMRAFAAGRLMLLETPAIVIGALLIALAIFTWIQAVLVSKVDVSIQENKLVTTGVYAWVRNPIYAAFMILCDGALLIAGNTYFFILPLVYWIFLTVLMKATEEKWLRNLYGHEYDDYCRQVNRCIPWPPGRDLLYETKISDARWITYDIPGNIGWIMYLVGLILCFEKEPEFISHEGIFAITVLAILPAVLMLIGIAELINERICKRDRNLPRVRLIRGFGLLSLGGISGAVISFLGFLCGMIVTESDLTYLIIMCIGALLCAVFAGLLYKGYHRIDAEREEAF